MDARVHTRLAYEATNSRLAVWDPMCSGRSEAGEVNLPDQDSQIPGREQRVRLLAPAAYLDLRADCSGSVRRHGRVPQAAGLKYGPDV